MFLIYVIISLIIHGIIAPAENFMGCPLENGEEPYCFICQICIGYDIQEIEKIKNLTTIINVYDSL